MTPRSFVRTPSASAEDASEQPQSEADSGDESLPPHTSEIGTLKKLPNRGTAWLGSSSGVYFVNTVRRAFSAALVDANTSITIPASEDILTGDDAEGRNYNGPVTDGPSVTEGDFRRVMLASLGSPPSDRELAMDLVTSFFRNWHPLFPFMHGPRFLQDIEAIYAMSEKTAANAFTLAEARRIATFQLIINIASLDRRDLQLPAESRIKSTSDVTRVAGCFSVGHDIATIQVMIAAELYLVATISLRQASTVAGMILKLIYHAGLHRCPLRYASLSIEDCEIRKRIFWTAYALDRHLSLSLGDPNTVQDNDIDVCLSGRELHKAVAHELIVNPTEEHRMHMPQPHAGPHGSGSPTDDPRVVDDDESPQSREKHQREAAMTAYVHYGKLTGRIIEIFHKSIHARFQKPEAITFLNSDIETWWNDLPASFTDEDDDEEIMTPSVPISQSHSPPNNDPSARGTPTSTTGTSHATPQSHHSQPSAPTHKQLAPFFLILYHQLLLLLNRPRLSLDQTTAEFQHGLQVCIKASRGTLTALRKHRDNGQSMLLPGLLSATWMAGLITAFACQLGKYPKNRAVSDIGSCLALLDSMGFSGWFTVKNCHKVLSLLLENIRSRRAGRDGMLSVDRSQREQQIKNENAAANAAAWISSQGPNPKKRTHDDLNAASAGGVLGEVAMASPKRKSMSEASPASSIDYSFHRMPPPVSNPRTPVMTSASMPPAPGTAVTGMGRQPVHRRNTVGGTNNNDNFVNTSPILNAPQQHTLSINTTTGEWPSPATTAHNPNRRSNSYASINTPPQTHHHSRSRSTNLGPEMSPFSNDLYRTTSGGTASMPMTPNPHVSGSAMYADPQDIAFAQAHHNLHFDPPFLGDNMNIEDPMFWGNLDYNMTDIFGAASWENMTGGAGPMGGPTSGSGFIWPGDYPGHPGG